MLVTLPALVWLPKTALIASAASFSLSSLFFLGHLGASGRVAPAPADE